MGNLASGHFKPTNNIQEQHNDRTLSPSYLIPQEFRGQNEVNRPSTQARELRDKIIENAKETYLIAFKQKLKSKSYQWSLVVNIKTNTTMSDLEKLAEHFEMKYGFQCYQIAIHRDEGYIDENNQPHINHHAHMEFVTLKKENGKNMWRQINQIKLRQIQTEIAQILGMERGTDKRVSGTERIEPRKYAQMKNKERKELEAKDKELNTLKQEKVDLINEIVKEAAERNPTNYLQELNERFKANRLVITNQHTIAFNDFEVPVFKDSKKIATRQHHETVEIPLNDEAWHAIQEAKKKEKALLDHKILNDKIDRDESVVISKLPKDLIGGFPNNKEETIRLAQVFSFVFKNSLILDWNNDTSTLSSNTNIRLKEAFSKVFGLDLETLELNFFKQDTTEKGEISVSVLEEPNFKGKLIGTNQEILIPIEHFFLKIETHRALNLRKSQIPLKNADELVQILLENALKEVQQERNALKEEIATALDTANEHFQSKAENLQEAVERNKSITEQYFLLDLLYNDPNSTNEYANKLVEKHKHRALFTKLWNAINLLLKILKKLFGDEKKTKKDHQDILNAITELQERPTKQQLEAKNKELNTLKQEKDNLTNQLQKQATETKKAQERIKTLESNETALKNDLHAKESAIQAKDKTIYELKKQIQDLKDNYNQERERMVAENKRLKEQGLEKIYTQKDYEQLKEQHEKEIQKYKTQETYTPTKRM
ncbi:hypothetical protein [Helicobacter pylori]|uniref:hypothetical protein n=1 Tax=Helicobacter pylori TaxID=210 RepID=UPI000BECAB98|nr:hypothetical protein [Helicobacter pylori]PDW19495.1 hypothetical protein BB436_03415 [Helicobacter pylori]